MSRRSDIEWLLADVVRAAQRVSVLADDGTIAGKAGPDGKGETALMELGVALERAGYPARLPRPSEQAMAEADKVMGR